MPWWSLAPAPSEPPDPWRDFHRRCVNSSGYEREAGLRLLARLPAELHGRALPLVLARLNDWVPQVRAAAVQALPLLLRDDLETEWIAALPVVAQLMSGSRWAEDGAAARATIEGFLLRSPSRRAALLACAPQFSRRVRRWLTVQSWRYGTPEEAMHSLLLELRGADAFLARQALLQLQARTPDWPTLPGVGDALARARFPALRLVALRHQQSRGQFPADAEAVELALSRHAATRGWVLFHASPELKARIQQHAERVLGHGLGVSVQLVALQVLHALRASSLPGLLAAMRAHPLARLREAAFVLGLSVCEPDEREGLTVRALADPSRRVQRSGLVALRRGQVSLTAPELLHLLRCQPAAVQPVLRALALLSAPTRVPAALQVLADYTLEPELAAEELRALVTALACHIYAPTVAESDAIRHAAMRLHQRRPELCVAVPKPLFKAFGVDALMVDAQRHRSS